MFAAAFSLRLLRFAAIFSLFSTLEVRRDIIVVTISRRPRSPLHFLFRCALRRPQVATRYACCKKEAARRLRRAAVRDAMRDAVKTVLARKCCAAPLAQQQMRRERSCHAVAAYFPRLHIL